MTNVCDNEILTRTASGLWTIAARTEPTRNS